MRMRLVFDLEMLRRQRGKDFCSQLIFDGSHRFENTRNLMHLATPIMGTLSELMARIRHRWPGEIGS